MYVEKVLNWHKKHYIILFNVIVPNIIQYSKFKRMCFRWALTKLRFYWFCCFFRYFFDIFIRFDRFSTMNLTDRKKADYINIITMNLWVNVNESTNTIHEQTWKKKKIPYEFFFSCHHFGMNIKIGNEIRKRQR